MMKLKTPTLFLWVVLIAGAAIAGEERQARELLIDADNKLHGDPAVRIIKRKADATSQIPLMRFVS